jgi:endonuclease/exonuclease/phosphatase (EEP) superfamily protein YafD
MDGYLMSPPRATAQSLSRASRIVAWLSWAYLFLLLVVSLLLFAVSENWWLSSALTYAPRQPWLLPAVGLLVASAVWHRPSVLVNLISTTVVAVPIMGLSLPVSHWMAGTVDSNGQTLKVLSCNVQDFRPDFASVLAEISRFNPDVVVFPGRSQPDQIAVAVF